MASFEDLKTIHNRKLEQAQELAKKLKIKLICGDLELLAQKMPERLKKTGAMTYVLDEKLLVDIDNKGSLEIEDRRGAPFLWGFEPDFTDELRLGDLLEHNKKIYSVQTLHESAFDGAEEVLQQIVDTLDDTLAKLRSRTGLDQWTYRYYSAHEDIACDTIQDVINVVVTRKP